MTATVVPPSPSEVDDHSLRQWHQIYKTPWEDLIAIGYVNGAQDHNNFTHILAITSQQGEIVVDGTDQTIAEKELDDAGEVCYMVSTSASDTGTVNIEGINGDGDCEVVSITLTGTTPVKVTSSHATDLWKNVHEVKNTSGTVLVGVIYVSTKTDAGTPANTDKIQVKVAIGEELGSSPLIMAGNAEVDVIKNFNFSCTVKDAVAIQVYKKPVGCTWLLESKLYLYENHLFYEPGVPFALVAGEKLVVSAIAGSTSAVTCEMDFYTLQQDGGAVNNNDGVNRLFRV